MEPSAETLLCISVLDLGPAARWKAGKLESQKANPDNSRREVDKRTGTL